MGTTERVALLVIVSAGLLAGVIDVIASGGGHLALSLLDIAMTASFAVFVVSPVLATSLLGTTVVLSYAADGFAPALFALAVSAGCVLRTGTANLVVAYVGGLLVAAAVATRAPVSATSDVAGCLLVATVMGGIGLALRSAHARSHRLGRELADRARRERAAILAERRRIAGELHDSIARDLTVIAMHVQLFGDDVYQDSRDVIRTAARSALDDVRAVMELADEDPNTDGTRFADLPSAFDEVRRTLEPMGYHVAIDGDPADRRIPESIEIALTWVLREAATNILKHAARGEVSIALDIVSASVCLTVHSVLPRTCRRDLPSNGHGLLRMTERVHGAGGRLKAGVEGRTWSVAAYFPLN